MIFSILDLLFTQYVYANPRKSGGLDVFFAKKRVSIWI